MKNERLYLRLTSELKFNLMMLAQKKGLTLSQLVINALDEYLKKEDN